MLRRESELALYVCEEGFDYGGQQYTRRGVFAAVGLEPWDRDVVLPHEHTLPKPKADRLSLLRATQTQLSPIISFFDDPDGSHRSWLDTVLTQSPDATASLPAGSVVEAASNHRLWVVNDARACRFLEEAMRTRQLFIADGHHRYETALAYQQERRHAIASSDRQPWDAVMMLLVASEDPGLKILPIHRVVKAPKSLDVDRFLAELQLQFDVRWTSPDTVISAMSAFDGEVGDAGGSDKHLFGLFGARSGQGALVSLKPGVRLEDELSAPSTAAWRSLDVAVLHSLILGPMLGIGTQEIASQQYVTYERDANAALRALDRGADLVFLMRPTLVSQVREVALAHDRMPQKSTFFYPKAVTGLVMYPLS